MTAEPESAPPAATARLEAALDRIGQAAAQAMLRAGREGQASTVDRTVEIGAKLDELIARVRDALNEG